ncbi:Uroporphyrinogen decarboxylase (URO-D) [Sporobacter termitidis DSM 10068]|uniref:Uroporphyrinogen decarboxylase (URO-D) n=1 Tax=Sporobacter termitidis DSM 10068 TaxID=1123282 RepID=A0A1M5XV96_9FIRM|nr:uroporphyrinogen decarboxylase family protein [Sporobacter termitidis]SHI03737.1 Uroporphyrinogen decarboxylase (URO-D) [Sporobacter termitidis DSM 10068]
MALTPRENGLEVINWGKPEYVPLTSEVYHYFRSASALMNHPYETGRDVFGVNWILTRDGAIPEPNKFLFTEISDWRKKVVFPDPNQYGFESCAKSDLKNIDKSERLINVISATGLFERLVAFMGFENALCALFEDPDECGEFFSALTDYFTRCLSGVIDAYRPDVITYFDDLATARGLFMSPEVYRSVIKPYHRKIVDCVTAKGVVFAQHICGKCEDILEDFVELGIQIWSSAQIMNDLQRIKKEFYGRLVIEGGWDTSGPCSYNEATVEVAIAEAKRCIEEYGPNGGFILQPTIMNERGNSSVVGDPRLDEIIRIWPEISRIY